MRILAAAAFALLLAPLGCTKPDPILPVTPPELVDADGDGVPDIVDECVTEKEDGLPPFPEDGCKADPNDLDGDGIGKADKCPNEPETKNGYQDDDGCPDELPEVQVTRDELRCDARILFGLNRAVIDPASGKLIDSIAKALKDNPEIELVEVAGHADSTGSAAKNVTLTKARAGAVIEALVARGIAPERMRPAGYGAYCPIEPGEDKLAREKNRRVEFKVLRQGGEVRRSELGCEAATKAGVVARPIPAFAIGR